MPYFISSMEFGKSSATMENCLILMRRTTWALTMRIMNHRKELYELVMTKMVDLETDEIVADEEL
jgi:hypothetical protein